MHQFEVRTMLLDKWKSPPTKATLVPKTFIRTNKELPELVKYGETLPNDYWLKWEKKLYHDLMPVNSWIKPEKVRAMAQTLGYMGREARLVRVLRRLEQGADLGCEGSSQLLTHENNSQSTYDLGVRVEDLLQSWIK